MFLTVFTPTYNRAYRLGTLYDSLCQQTMTDFEWLIVDDGSTDATEKIIKEWIKEGVIRIRYFKQQNGGKHRAINKGVQESHGEMFLIVDSDDSLTLNSIERIYHHYLKIKDRKEFAGVCGCRAYSDGKIIRNPSFDVVECTNFERMYCYRLIGDMAEVFYTSILRKFPFPEITDEKFCPEILIWNRIARKYKIRHFGEGIYIGEYLPDGLTAKITKIRMNSPVGTSMTYAELLDAPIPLWAKIKSAINYYRFSKYASKDKLPKIGITWIFFKPLGNLMAYRDQRRNKV